jgi:hypothetical protein
MDKHPGFCTEHRGLLYLPTLRLPSPRLGCFLHGDRLSSVACLQVHQLASCLLGNMLAHHHRVCLGCRADKGSIYREGFGDRGLLIAQKRDSQMI